MTILSFLDPAATRSKGVSGSSFVRLENNAVNFSTTLAKELGMIPKQTTLTFAVVEHQGSKLYAIILNYPENAMLLRGNSKSACVNSKILAETIAKHYNLETIIDPKGDFKFHRFTHFLSDIGGKTAIILEQPKKYGK